MTHNLLIISFGSKACDGWLSHQIYCNNFRSDLHKKQEIQTQTSKLMNEY